MYCTHTYTYTYTYTYVHVHVHVYNFKFNIYLSADRRFLATHTPPPLDLRMLLQIQL